MSAPSTVYRVATQVTRGKLCAPLVLSRKYGEEPPKPKKDTPANKAAGNEYNAPEYYQHNPMTYYDFEMIMRKHRLPQPSSSK